MPGGLLCAGAGGAVPYGGNPLSVLAFLELTFESLESVVYSFLESVGGLCGGHIAVGGFENEHHNLFVHGCFGFNYSKGYFYGI